MNDRLYRQVADAIADEIYAGKYKVGARLPTERELARQFKLGRPVIREALIALELFGMVSIRHGAGIYVEPWQNQPLKVNIFDRGVNPFAVIDARLIVEPEVAAAAAVIISDRELLDLRAIIQHMIDSYRDLPSYSFYDREFHITIARAGRNAPLIGVIDCLWALHGVRGYWRQLREYMPRDKLQGERLDEHMAIHSALERHDPDGVRAAMENHLKRAKATLLDAAERMRADGRREASLA